MNDYDPNDPTLLVNIFNKERDMARPPSDNPASATVKARCTPDEKVELRHRAASAGVTLSEYLLRCALPGKAPRASSKDGAR